MLQEHLANGPKPGERASRLPLAAADIAERSLIVAADALGVRTRRGH
jgi:hypothetical protein